ncbi:MAG: hypothetical protein MJB57_09690 [Gemmatimonadetes bacterium]|nr:hypothetical protein [Gemmatimonadota bacterium]
MVTMGALLVPILVAAVLVFVVSSLVWMVLPHHKNDYSGLPNEAAVLEALGDVPRGVYDFPHMSSWDEMKQDDTKERFAKGPVGFFTVAPKGLPNMGKNMGIWLLYCVFVGAFVSYVAGRTLPAGTEYLRVFQITGAVAWAAYGFSHVSEAVWFARPWSLIAKQLIDAFLYALVTAGAFAWLWP